MSSNSKIEWCTDTWNPVTGCTKVSAGCDHCYAERITERFHGPGSFERVQLHEDRLEEPRHWRKPRRVFVNSMSDLFHDDVPDEFIARVWEIMAATPRHTYQILTKRPARMRAWLRRCRQWDGYITDNGKACSAYGGTGVIVGRPESWPLPNVWLGVSVEDQKRAELRIPRLLTTPAAIRFLSCEPLLAPIDLKRAVWTMGSERGHGLTASFVHGGGCCDRFHGIDWVIVGGESGPKARPMLPDWARSLRDQCQAAEIPYFFKQFGEWAPTGAVGIGGHDPKRGFVGGPKDEHGCREEIARVGKRAAGRILDGRLWDEFPGLAQGAAA